MSYQMKKLFSISIAWAKVIGLLWLFILFQFQAFFHSLLLFMPLAIITWVSFEKHRKAAWALTFPTTNLPASQA